MNSMRLVFAGTPDVAVPSLRALAGDEEVDVVGVLTRNDAPVGRKRVLTPSPVADAAGELGIPVHKANRLEGAEADWVRDLHPDLGVIVAYGGLVPTSILQIPRHGWVNLHFSDLPNLRGAAPVQRALMAGEQRLGVTVFQLVEALDAGAVLTRDARTFPPGTAAGDALAVLADFGTEALRRAVAGVREQTLTAEPQVGEPSYASKLERGDGALDLGRSASEVLAHWAGVTPEPGAFVLSDGVPLKLLELRQTSITEPALEVGTVAFADRRPLLHLTDDVLEVVRVQPAGKGAMNAADWLRGRGGRHLLESAQDGGAA